jgi:hypothetical protein
MVFDNRLADVFVGGIKPFTGAVVEFSIDERSKRDLREDSSDYAGAAYEFSKTMVRIEVFKTEGEYVSRSQSRHVLNGLEKFKKVVLNFNGVLILGRAFADEVMRVWKVDHSTIRIELRNANQSTRFMAQHVVSVS